MSYHNPFLIGASDIVYRVETNRTGTTATLSCDVLGAHLPFRRGPFRGYHDTSFVISPDNVTCTRFPGETQLSIVSQGRESIVYRAHVSAVRAEASTPSRVMAQLYETLALGVSFDAPQTLRISGDECEKVSLALLHKRDEILEQR